jgi:hypothetical protein
MTSRLRRVHVAICLIVLCAAWPAVLPAQSSECDDAAARKGWEDQSSPVYADATDLARTLSGRGFVIECIRRSKEEHLFKDQKGAAWFKTNQGIFEVWFLTSTDILPGSELQIVEQRLNNGPPQFLIKNGNAVFHVNNNEQLAVLIQKAFQKS